MDAGVYSKLLHFVFEHVRSRSPSIVLCDLHVEDSGCSVPGFLMYRSGGGLCWISQHFKTILGWSDFQRYLCIQPVSTYTEGMKDYWRTHKAAFRLLVCNNHSCLLTGSTLQDLREKSFKSATATIHARHWTWSFLYAEQNILPLSLVPFQN